MVTITSLAKQAAHGQVKQAGIGGQMLGAADSLLGKLPGMAQQSPCHIPYVKFPTIFQKSLACLNENRYLPPNFERPKERTAKK